MVPKAEKQTGDKMNTQIESTVTEYAKANKINKAKLLAFAEQIVYLAGVKQKKESSGKRGKPVSQETIALREALRDAIKSTTEAFTVKDMQSKIGGEYVNVSNALRFLAEKEKLVAVIGKVATAPGVRGKKPLLWSVA